MFPVSKLLSSVLTTPSACALLLCVCCAGCGDHSSADERERNTAKPVPLRVHVIRPRLTNNATKTIVCYGKFRPVQESRLQFGRPGVVAKILKTVGESVVEGDLLAELQQDEIQDQISKLRSDLGKLQSSLPTLPPAEAAKQRAKVGQLQGQLVQFEAQQSAGRLTADFSGTVVKTNFEVGTLAVPGRSVLVIADKQSPVVDLSLDSTTAADLPDGYRVWVGHNGRAMPTSISSRQVLTTEGGPRESGSQRITLEFQQPLDADSWAYDSVVEVRYRRFQGESGYWIPMTALNRSTDGGWSVLIADKTQDSSVLIADKTQDSSVLVADETQGSADKQAVLRSQACEVIRHQNRLVLISAVEPNDALIVLDGSHRVVPGQTVVPVELFADESGKFRASGDQ